MRRTQDGSLGNETLREGQRRKDEAEAQKRGTGKNKRTVVSYNLSDTYDLTETLSEMFLAHAQPHTKRMCEHTFTVKTNLCTH